MSHWFKENWFKVGLLVAAIIGVISIAYYFIILSPDLKRTQENRQRLEIYRRECAKEIENDFKFFDNSNLPPELIKTGLKNKGYINEAGYIIQTDILVKRCVDSKVLIYK